MQIIVIILLVAILLLILGSGLMMRAFLNRKQINKGEAPPKKETTPSVGPNDISFRWKYVLLPLVVLALSIAIALIFYPRLPAQVAYQFKSDGSPDTWTAKNTALLTLLIPQLLLTLVALGLTWGITLLPIMRQFQSTLISPGRILAVMGNMFALPQIILAFAMLEIFSYNAYQIHLLRIWVFALVVAFIGAIILGIYFVQTIQQVWRSNR